MNFKAPLLVFFLLLIATVSAKAQLRIISATGMVANVSESVTDVDETLLGGALSIDYPVKSITLRGDIFYVTGNGTDAAPAPLDYLFGYRGYVGYVIGDGNRTQFPLFVGYGLYRSEGDLVLNRSGFSGRAGVRYFVTNDLALVANAGYDRLSQVNDREPGFIQLNIGLAYSYSR